MGLHLPLITDVLGRYVTTGAGAADGSTLVATGLAANDNDYQGMTVQILASSTARLVNQRREIVTYTSATGTCLFDPAFPAQVPNGTAFEVIRDRPQIGAAAGPIVAFQGVADAGGDADTLRDAALTQADDYWNGCLVIFISGANVGLGRIVEDFVAATDDLQMMRPFPAAIAAGDQYVIVAFSDLAPPADDTADELFQQVIGRKADVAVQAVGATASTIAVVKALKTNQGDPSGHTLTTWTAKWGNLAQSFAAWAGDMSAHALTSIAAKWGNMTETLLVVLGARADAAVQDQTDASMHARLKGILLAVANPTIVSATFTYADIAGEQTIFTVAPAAGQVWDLLYMEFDVSALTQNATLRIDKRVDGVTFRTVTELTALSTDEAEFDSEHYQVDNTSQLQVTIERAAAEGAARSIPYRYYYHRLV